jgi:hypothetical protein
MALTAYTATFRFSDTYQKNRLNFRLFNGVRHAWSNLVQVT